MAGNNPITRIIITAADNTKSGIESAQKSVQGFANNVSGMLKAAFAGLAAYGLGSFFKSAIEESAKSANNLAQVTGALRAVGVNAEAVMPKVNGAVNALSDLSGFDDDDLQVAFANLVRRTGDYQKALQLLPEAADVAAAHQMDLASASEAVAKAQEGNVKAQRLVMNTQGAAAAQGQTLAGTLGRMKTAYGNLLQAIGDGISGTDQFGKSSNWLVTVMVNLANWIENNSGYFQSFFAGVEDVVGIVVTLGKHVLDLGNRIFGDVLRSAVSRSQGTFTLFKNTLGDVIEGLYDFLKPVASVAGAVVKMLSPAVIEAWRGWMLILSTAANGLGQLGASAELAFGKLLQGLAAFGHGANKVLSFFGVSISESFLKSMQDMGDAAADRGTATLGALQQKLEDRLEAFQRGDDLKPNAAKSDKASKPKTTALGVTPISDGPDEAPSNGKKDAVLEEVKQQEALLAITSHRADALARLTAIENEQRAIATDTTKSAAEQAKASERMQAAEKARTDFLKEQESQSNEAFKDRVDLLTADMGLADRRNAAQQELIALALQYKAIAEDTSKTDKERADALERMKAAMKAGGITENPTTTDTSSTGKVTVNADGSQSVTGIQVTQTDTPQTPNEPDLAPQNAGQGMASALQSSGKVLDNINSLTANAIDSVGELQGEIGSFATTSLVSLGDAFANAFQQAIDGSQSLGKALIGAAKAAVANEAMVRGRLSFVKAAEALAAGFFTGDPKMFVAAAKYAATGTAYMGLAAAMGKGGGGGSVSGGGAGPGSAGGTSTSGLHDTQQHNQVQQGESEIIVKGGYWPNDPRFLDQLSQAINAAKGNRIIISTEY